LLLGSFKAGCRTIRVEVLSQVERPKRLVLKASAFGVLLQVTICPLLGSDSVVHEIRGLWQVHPARGGHWRTWSKADISETAGIWFAQAIYRQQSMLNLPRTCLRSNEHEPTPAAIDVKCRIARYIAEKLL
jgi:hypothetical protein